MDTIVGTIASILLFAGMLATAFFGVQFMVLMHKRWSGGSAVHVGAIARQYVHGAPAPLMGSMNFQVLDREASGGKKKGNRWALGGLLVMVAIVFIGGQAGVNTGILAGVGMTVFLICRYIGRTVSGGVSDEYDDTRIADFAKNNHIEFYAEPVANDFPLQTKGAVNLGMIRSELNARSYTVQFSRTNPTGRVPSVHYAAVTVPIARGYEQVAAEYIEQKDVLVLESAPGDGVISFVYVSHMLFSAADMRNLFSVIDEMTRFA